jgi:antirestriction protein ArdC
MSLEVEGASSQGMGYQERKRYLVGKLNELAADLVLDKDKLKAFGERWKAGFHPYSFYNMLLIWSQKPIATLCAGFNQWKKHKRYVKKGEKALWVLAPGFTKVIKKDEETGADVETEEKQIAFFFPVPVFDYSQTDGQELEIGNTLINGNGNLKVEEVAKLFPYPLEFSQGIADGWTDGKKILVSRRENKAQEMACYFHELAHNLCGHLEEKQKVNLTREQKELEAEATSYLVCACLGIENDGAKYYVGAWHGDRDRLGKSALRILRTAEKILRKVKPESFQKRIGEN